MSKSRRRNWFWVIAPGILVAATGVGAGDLMTASFAGSKLGLAVVWAVIFGGVMKWVLNEGLARWQVATGTTLLAGWVRRLRIQWIFLLYLVVWSFAVGGALISACGVAGHALLPLSDDLRTSKIIWGIVHSLAGVVLVFVGGFRLFERLMAVCIGIMFVTAGYCAARMLPGLDWSSVTFVNPLDLRGEQLNWTLALIGGVGGTLTLLSYGYWIREQNRTGVEGVRLCRVDLAVGYTITALFGVSMIIIAASIPGLGKKGPELALTLGERLTEFIGPTGKFVFLLGFWGAVFSSLLGVWQSVPYMFADFLREVGWTKRDERDEVDYAQTWPYRVFLLYLALPPIVTLWFQLKSVQLLYALLGALFMPLLAGTLLIMNNRRSWVGPRLRSGWVINALLILTLGFFVWTGFQKAAASLRSAPPPPQTLPAGQSPR